jgi:hypothetical protein
MIKLNTITQNTSTTYTIRVYACARVDVSQILHWPKDKLTCVDKLLLVKCSQQLTISQVGMHIH